MNDNEDLGKITDIDDVKNNRNTIETGIKRNNGEKTVKTIFAIVAALILFGGIAMTIFNFDNKDNAIEVKQDEALQTQSLNTNSLASQMEEIKRQQEEKERLRKEKEEKERQLKEEEEKNRLFQQQEDERINSIIGNSTLPINSQQEQGGTPVLTPSQRRLDGDTLIFSDSNNSNRTIDNDNQKSEDGGLNGMLAGGVYSNGSATILSNKRNLLLIHGTQIPCALRTRLVTDQPSILICQVTKDIFSADGTTLLIERGSNVFGEQKKAIITGQNMAFVNWSEVDTPHGVRIRIDSLGTDSLGASGINVWVDEKWGKRFGGSIMLSFIQDALATASTTAQNNSSKNEVVYDNSEKNTGRMAEIALENSINIQPTGYANQGQLINILVARDIDFSNVYSLSEVGIK
ncbi:type IV secretion system protein VirB10 [Gilliamella sp. BG6]|uniref:type IV secretion system protein VirB10 n=1 Tax=unclassified Gilliamella TaxID=2685620 RepID=UPI003987D178